VEAWRGYLRLCEQLLSPEDYVEIRGRKYKKKSAWRKLAKAFNITDQIAEQDIVLDQLGRVVSARFVTRVIAPNGRIVEAWGSCSFSERAHVEDKEDRYGNICAGPCDGRNHYSNPNHDIPATAHTRSKNRGISDMIGAGEVSAEEIQTEDLREEGEAEPKAKALRKSRPKKKPKVTRKKPPTKKNNEPVARPASFTESPADPTKAEWKWLNQELALAGVSQQEAIACIGDVGVSHWHQREPGRTLDEALTEILAVAGKAPPEPPEEADLPQPGDIISDEQIPF